MHEAWVPAEAKRAAKQETSQPMQEQIKELRNSSPQNTKLSTKRRQRVAAIGCTIWRFLSLAAISVCRESHGNERNPAVHLVQTRDPSDKRWRRSAGAQEPSRAPPGRAEVRAGS